MLQSRSSELSLGRSGNAFRTAAGVSLKSVSECWLGWRNLEVRMLWLCRKGRESQVGSEGQTQRARGTGKNEQKAAVTHVHCPGRRKFYLISGNG